MKFKPGDRATDETMTDDSLDRLRSLVRFAGDFNNPKRVTDADIDRWLSENPHTRDNLRVQRAVAMIRQRERV